MKSFNPPKKTQDLCKAKAFNIRFQQVSEDLVNVTAVILVGADSGRLRRLAVLSAMARNAWEVWGSCEVSFFLKVYKKCFEIGWFFALRAT